MAVPRDSDDPDTARLRQVLSDPELMQQVTAQVDAWPPLADEIRETLAALLNPPRRIA